jgi:hypothetical protein
VKRIYKTMVFLVLFLGRVTFSEKVFGNDNPENTVFSNNGTVSYQDNDYLFVGALVEDLQKTLEIWSVPDSQGFPNLSTITKIKRNEPISVFLTYATRKNEINMTYDFKTLRPDGSFSHNIYKGLEIARGNSPDTLLYRARKLPVIVFDETDSFGTYQFHINIFDNNNLITIFILEFNLMEQ